MNYIPLNYRWMYDRCYSGRRSLRESLVERVEKFVSKASLQDYYHNNGGLDALMLDAIVQGFWVIEL